jgi:hypothetical protein
MKIIYVYPALINVKMCKLQQEREASKKTNLQDKKFSNFKSLKQPQSKCFYD